MAGRSALRRDLVNTKERHQMTKKDLEAIATANQYYSDYLKELVGGKIIQVVVQTDAENPLAEPYLGYIIKKGKKTFQFIALGDPEGNGSGHIEITEVEGQK